MFFVILGIFGVLLGVVGTVISITMHMPRYAAGYFALCLLNTVLIVVNYNLYMR